MKKKVLLVGKISEILGSIHDSLDAEFDVQMCSTQLSSVAGMIKVLKPSLIVICTVGVYDLEADFAPWLEKNGGDMPVVFIVKKEEVWDFKKFCFSTRYTYLHPPINLDTILDTCKSLMSGGTSEAVEVTPRLKQILTIDDSPLVLRYVKNILKDEYEVLLATSGEMGLKKAKEVHPALILLDYEMPVMDGKETFLNLKVDEETEDIPVIFLTSVSDTKKVKEVLDMKPAGYILKPLDAEQLLTKVHKALGETPQPKPKSNTGSKIIDFPIF
jgi:DNA-binding response OmpR family regulator